MPTINPYLTFNGNSCEAMNFYKECLGGEVDFIVLHSSLKTAELEIMATDMQPEKFIQGNSDHLCLVFKKEEEMRSLFDKLSAGGKVKQPINMMFFGLIGTLTDKFGKHWILECDKK